MDLYLTTGVMILGWIFLILSWYIEDKWGTIFTGIVSMIWFFLSAAFYQWITIPYHFISSTDTIIIGETHLAGYQPISYLCMVFGFIALVWTFIIAFYDMLLPTLKKLGVT